MFVYFADKEYNKIMTQSTTLETVTFLIAGIIMASPDAAIMYEIAALQLFDGSFNLDSKFCQTIRVNQSAVDQGKYDNMDMI